MNSRLHPSQSAVLVLTALAALLAVAAGLLWLSGRGDDAMRVQGEPMTDAQAAAQVLGSAKQIVSTAELREVTGGYAFVSCKNANEPPYQVTVYCSRTDDEGPQHPIDAGVVRRSVILGDQRAPE